MHGEPTLSPTVAREFLRLIAAARGLEVAGLLLENSAGEQRIQRAPNLHSEPGNVEVPRWWLDRMLARQDGAGFHPVAFFHSHLSSLDLSETDRASLPGFPIPWIVLLVREGQLSWAVFGSAERAPRMDAAGVAQSLSGDH